MMKHNPEKNFWQSGVDAWDGFMERQHEKNPTLRVCSEAVCEVIQDTRKQTIEDAKAIAGIPEKAITELQTKIDSLLSGLPAEHATALRSMIAITPFGVSLLIPDTASATDEIAYGQMTQGTNFSGSGKSYNPIKEVVGGTNEIAAIEGLALMIYGGLGIIGFRGSAWDDAGRGIGVGIIGQILATSYAWSQDWGHPFLIGIVGGVSLVTINGIRKLARNKYIKSTSPPSNTNTQSNTGSSRPSSKKNP